MFFSSKKKTARQIAAAVSNTFKPSFAFSAYLDRATGQLKPPDGFWRDAYILGFVHTLIGSFLHFVFNGPSMSTEKKGEIIILSMQEICGNAWQQALFDANNYALNKDNSEFQRGQNDASTLFGAIHGMLKPDDQDPVLIAAKSLASNLQGEGSLGGSIMILTIGKHIRSHYLKEKSA